MVLAIAYDDISDKNRCSSAITDILCARVQCVRVGGSRPLFEEEQI
jgi:hypothetical protein